MQQITKNPVIFINLGTGGIYIRETLRARSAPPKIMPLESHMYLNFHIHPLVYFIFSVSNLYCYSGFRSLKSEASKNGNPLKPR